MQTISHPTSLGKVSRVTPLPLLVWAFTSFRTNTMNACSKGHESKLVSWLPYDVCNHFIRRPIYQEILENAFNGEPRNGKTFVLWGLGGVG